MEDLKILDQTVQWNQGLGGQYFLLTKDWSVV